MAGDFSVKPLALKLLTTMNNSETQQAVAQEVNDRMAQATQELAAKYAAGKGGLDVSETGPTGKAYQEKEAREIREPPRLYDISYFCPCP